MNRLYFLPVAGHGTEDVEALSSYVMRIAALHATSISILLEHLQPQSLRSFRTLGSWRGLGACIRPKSLSSALLGALADAIGVEVEELEPTTLLAFESCPASVNDECSANPRWCPTCFRDQSKAGQPVYFKLVWQLRQTTSCHLHKVRLRDRCDKCGQFPYRRRRMLSPLDQCGNCHQSMNEASLPDLSPEHPMDNQLVGLVGHIARNPGVRFPVSGVSAVMSNLVDEAVTTGTEEGLYRFVRRDDCLHFAETNASVSLNATLQIAFRLRIPLLSLLEGDATGTTRSLLCLHDGRRAALLAPIDRRCRKPEDERRVRDWSSQRSSAAERSSTPSNSASPSTHLGVLRVYLRVSASSHDLVRQHEILRSARDAGWHVAGVYRETAAGERECRPELSRLIDEMMPGDVAMFETLSRLRSLKSQEADRLVASLREKGVLLSVPGVIELSDFFGRADEISMLIQDAAQKVLLRVLLWECRHDSIARCGGRRASRRSSTPLHEMIVELRNAGNSISRTAREAQCSPALVKRVWADHLDG